MKKIVALGLAATLTLSSCGMKWNQTVKNLKSDFGGGLDRIIVVENTRTGNEVFSFEGKAYIDDDSTAGNFTVVCTLPDGTTKKFDFIGKDYGIRSFEK